MKTKTLVCTLALMSMATVASAENMLEERLRTEVEPGTIPIFACQLGERIAIDAKGVSRVSTDSSKILEVSVDGDTLYITCQDLGTTQLTVHRGDRIESVIVRAGTPHDEEVEMSACGDVRGSKARVVLDRSGRVQQVLVSAAVDSRAACIREALREKTWTDGESFLRVARFDW